MTENKNGEQRILCMLGFPGSGKSVLLKKLSRDFGLAPRHLGTFVRESRSLTEEEIFRSQQGQLLEGYDEAFLDSITQSPLPWILLDGFPRSERQFKLLRERRSPTRRIAVVCLSFPVGKEGAFSFRRQQARAVHQGLQGDSLEQELFRIEKKIERALAVDLPVIELARNEFPDFIELDVTKGSRPAYRLLCPWIENRLGLSRQPSPSTSQKQ